MSFIRNQGEGIGSYFLTSLYSRMFITIISIISTVIIISNTYGYSGNRLLFLLPLIYGILMIIFPAVWDSRKGHIGLTVLNGVIFIRYVIAPTLRSLAISDGPFRGYVPSPQGLQSGILLMVLELLIVFIIVQLLSKKFYKESSQSRHEFEPPKSNYILIIVLVLSISLMLVFPSLLDRYNFFIVSTDNFQEKSLDIPLDGLIILLTDLTIIILPIILLNLLKKKYELRNSLIYVFLSLISVLPGMMIFKGTSRFSVLVPTLAWMIILLKLYPKYKKILIISVITILVTVFISITLIKQFGYSQESSSITKKMSLSEISYNFDAYFSGPDNMGRAVDLDHYYGNKITLKTLGNDLINNVAILSTFSEPTNTTTAWFNYLFYSMPEKIDQIVPLTGQSYIHFGILGSPILLSLTLIIMMWFDGKISRENRMEHVYIYVYLVVYMSMAMMLSYGSIYPIFTNLYIPILILFTLNRKITLK
jgi:oligosaccharide repeat unit polymerase